MASTMKEDIPRKYQEEIFLRAQKENIIAAMNTGSGKTLISLLLIKWIAAQEAHKDKVVVFLVPKVTLVKQQAVYLQRRLPSEFKVTMLHGSLDLELTDRKGWKKRIEGSGVLVMTAQVFLNLLTHSLWSLNKVSLMIFDECHHARKNHPYNVIMREYVHAKPLAEVPKIFGMTASPTWDVKNPQRSMEELEQNLHAKIIGVREHVHEMEEHSARPTEIIKLYPHPSEDYDYPYPTIYQALSVIDIQTWNKLLTVDWTTVEKRYQATLYNIGLMPANMFLFQEIQYHVFTYIRENRHRVLKALEQNEEVVSVDSKDEETQTTLPTKPSVPEELFLVIDILVDFQPVFFPADPSLSLAADLMQWSTPKVHTLVDLLLQYHSPSFQCMIFVEQRQTASTLARMLSLDPRIRGKITCGHLVGTGVGADGLSRQNDIPTRDVVQDFRDGNINTLITTSVAEEGLDFKECDLVVRFDGLQHNVAYVQSRGRARKKASTFVILVAQNDEEQIAKYEAFRENEPELKMAYQTRHLEEEDPSRAESDDEDMDDTHPDDLARRERHVETSGALLTYDNCVSLLNNLCALIPRDQYTSVHLPNYTYDYINLPTTALFNPSFDPLSVGCSATVTLPSALSLPRDELMHEGPPRRSKREAKRAAAWKAVRRLRELDVYDEHLYAVPIEVDDDADGTAGRLQASNRSAREAVKDTGPIMTVDVVDPWVIGQKLWIHLVLLGEEVVGGLVCSTEFPPIDTFSGDKRIRTCKPRLLPLIDGKAEKMATMNEFTRHSVWLANTSKKTPPQMSFYFVPVTDEGQPDFHAMDLALKYSRGSDDWTLIDEDNLQNVFVHCKHRVGSVYNLHRIRHDLSPLSTPPPGSLEDKFPTYRDYYTYNWSSKMRHVTAPSDGPLVEVIRLTRNNSAGVSRVTSEPGSPVHTVPNGRIYPLKSCLWYLYPVSLRTAYLHLPELAHQLTVHHRAYRLRAQLALPPIPTSLLIEATTIPSAMKDYSNQRLETLGDAVLQVLTTVHLYMHYPNRHEGQLTRLRQRCVANRVLFQRARDLGLEKFVNTEGPHYQKWRYVLPEGTPLYYEQDKRVSRERRREVPRRSLQDCMEALLGTSYLEGGMDLALKTASLLGMEVGAPVPWYMRASEVKESHEADELSLMFQGLEKDLGYKFKSNALLREALTHPSFATDGPSYQRLEFLGDAILELVVTDHLYQHFPNATSHQLSHARTKAICSPTLAQIAVRKLKLHNLLFINSVPLNFAIEDHLPILEAVSVQDVLRNGWRYDPPKAISDVFESVMGAVFVDSGYDYQKTANVMRAVMDEVFEYLSPDLALDPMSVLTRWVAGSGCQARVRVEKRLKKMHAYDKEGMAILLHGTVVVEPVVSTSLTVAKFLAAEMALDILKEESSDRSLKKICVCSQINDAADVLAASSVADIPDVVLLGEEDVVGVQGFDIEEHPASEADDSDATEVESILLEKNDAKMDPLKEDATRPLDNDIGRCDAGMVMA